MSNWNQGFKYIGKAIEGQIERVGESMCAKVKLEVTKGPCAGQRIMYQGWITGANGAPSPPNAARTGDELRAMGASLRSGWRDLGGLGSKEVEFTAKGELSTQGPNAGKTFWKAAYVRTPSKLDAARAASEDDLAGIAPPPPAGSSLANGQRVELAPADEQEEAADPGQDSLAF